MTEEVVERLPCPYCQRTFATSNDRWQHATKKHPGKSLKSIKGARQEELDRRARERGEEESIGSLVAEAQLNRAMGLPVDGWIADMFDV